MEDSDLTYYPLFRDKEFLNEDWHSYTCIESCAAIEDARHGCESLRTDIQSIREIDDSGCMLTNITGSSILKSTDHTSQVKPGKLSVIFILGDICQILFDIIEDQSDVHGRAVKETAISGHPQSDQLRSGKPRWGTWYTHYYHYI